jgi:hypothetical protein
MGKSCSKAAEMAGPEPSDRDEAKKKHKRSSHGEFELKLNPRDNTYSIKVDQNTNNSGWGGVWAVPKIFGELGCECCLEIGKHLKPTVFVYTCCREDSLNLC